MGLELAKAYITARGDTSQVPRDLNAGKGKIQNAAQGLASTINRALALVGVGIGIGVMVSQAKQYIGLAERQIHAESRVAAVIKGTGMAAGFTAEQLKKKASALQAVTMVGDEEILELQAKLLTFKSITGDVFDKATSVVLNMAAVMGTNASGAALQLGRALEDPVRGVSALRRTGVSFSEAQKVIIKQFVETNQLAKAQAYILDTVQGQLGDVAKEMAKMDAGKLQQARNVLGDVREEMGKKLIPLSIKFNDMMIDVAESLLPVVGRFAVLAKSGGEMGDKLFRIVGGVGKLTVGITLIAAAIGAARLVTLQLNVVFGLMIAHPVVAVLTAIAAAAVIATAEFAAANAVMREGLEISKKFLDVTKSRGKEAKNEIERLKELAAKQQLSNEEMDEADKIIKGLTGYYGELGIMLDRSKKSITGVAEAQQKLVESQLRLTAVNLKARMIDVSKQYDEAKGKANGFFRNQSHWREETKKLNKELIALQLALGDVNMAMRGDKKPEFAFEKPKFIGFDMSSANTAIVDWIRNRFSPVVQAASTQSGIIGSNLMMGLEGADEALGKLGLNTAWRNLQAMFRGPGSISGELKRAGEILTEKWMTPLEKIQREFEMLKKTWATLTPETRERALLGMKTELEGLMKGENVEVSGRFGIGDFGKRIQDAILAKKNPQVVELQKANTWLERIESKLLDVNKREPVQGLRAPA